MADLKKTVELIFSGVDKTGSSISSVGRNLDALTDKAGNITGPMASAADSILKLEAALVAAGAAVMAFATKEAVAFEAALIDLQKVMSDGEGDAQDYSDTFADLSSRFGVEAASIIQSAADFRQAGFGINDSLTLVEQSLLAVNAADLTTQQSSELLIGTLAGFQAPASEASHLLDVLNGVANNAGASVEKLGDGFKILSPIAETLGLSFEETAALLTPVVEVTRSGSESANALRTAISNLIKPTKERKELLEDELGIQLEANGERRNTKDVLYDLIDATKDLDGNEKQRIATVIAGAQQMSRFLAVLNNSERSEEILKIAMESSGSAVEEFNVKAESAEFAMKQLNAAFTTTAATAGLEYIDQTKQVTQATTNLMDGFREAIQGDNADVLFEALRSGLSDLANRIDVIAENLPEAFEGVDLTGLVDSFGDLGGELSDSFKAVFGEIDLTTVEGLQEALQKIVDGFTALTNVTSGIIDGLEPLFKAIGAGAEEFQDLDSATQRSIGELLGLAKAVDEVLPLIGGLATGLDSVGTGLTALAGAQGFRALIGNLESVKSIAKTAGRGGLVGLALAGGYGIGTLINDHIIEPLEDYFGGTIGGWLYEMLNADELDRIAQSFAPVSEAMQRLNQDTKDLRDMNASLDNMLEETTVATDETQQSWQDYADGLVEAANEQKVVTETLDTSKGALDGVTGAARNLAVENKSVAVGFDEATGKANDFSGKIVTTTKNIKDATEKTEEVTKKSEAYQQKMMELASNEKIAQIKSKVSLDIAEAESNAKKVEAIAGTIGEAFQSTGDVISSIFGSDAPDWDRFGFESREQLKKENEIRREQVELQKKLTESEINYIKQKTQNLRSGDSMIKVDGSGLQPHLEAFMFEILREIQVRVNADGEEMLLGLGS